MGQVSHLNSGKETYFAFPVPYISVHTKQINNRGEHTKYYQQILKLTTANTFISWPPRKSHKTLGVVVGTRRMYICKLFTIQRCL